MLMHVKSTEAGGRVEARPPRRRRHVLSFAATWFVLAILAAVLRTALDDASLPKPFLDGVGYFCVALFAFSMLMGLARAVLAVRDGAGAAFLGNLVLAGFSFLGSSIALVATQGFSRGRQLRRFGRVLLPRLRPSAVWTTVDVALNASERDDAPAGLADQWRENGKTEHASVAAFARLTLDLMALGAPPALIADVQQDTLDEIRHAELCFSLAHALDGQSVSPAAFGDARRVASLSRSRTLALATLAVDSLVDGALHEGVSARIIARLAQRCAVESVRAILKEIAADEGRHSAHGWAVVAWCLEEGGGPVAAALEGALRTLPKSMRSQLPEPAAQGGWERWGIHGHRLEAEEYAAALAHLAVRVHEMTGSRLRPAA